MIQLTENLQNLIKKSSKFIKNPVNFMKYRKALPTHSQLEKGVTKRNKQQQQQVKYNIVVAHVFPTQKIFFTWDVRDVEKEGKKLRKKVGKKKEKTTMRRKKACEQEREKERRKWQCVVEALFTN